MEEQERHSRFPTASRRAPNDRSYGVAVDQDAMASEIPLGAALAVRELGDRS